jgi:hypothetical protein
MPGLFSSNYIFRCKAISLIFVILLAASAHAQNAKSEKKGAKPVSLPKYHSLALSFTSWQETLKLTEGTVTADAPVNIFGNAISYSYQNFFSPRHGSILELGFFSGTANQGGIQTDVTYSLASVNCTAVLFSYRYAYRVSKAAIVSMGLLGVSRQLKWPPDTVSGATGISGSNSNYGPLVELKMRMSEAWSLEQKLGLLTRNAGAFWSLGIGYTF